MGQNNERLIRDSEEPQRPNDDGLWDGDPDVTPLTSLRGPWAKKIRDRRKKLQEVLQGLKPRQ